MSGEYRRGRTAPYFPGMSFRFIRVAALLVAIGLVVYKTLGNAINDQNSGTGAKVLESTTFQP